MSDLSLAVSVGEKHTLGEPVNPRVTITNNTSKLVLFPDIRDWRAPQPIYLIDRPDGTTVVHDPQQDRPRYSDMHHLPRALLTGIEPDQSFEETLLLTRYVRLDVPGKYTITARFKWDQYDLESEPVTFTLVSATISDIVLHEFVRDLEAPRAANEDEPGSWSLQPLYVAFQATEGQSRARAADSWLDWAEPEELWYRSEEWPLTVGSFDVSEDDVPAGVRLLPKQATGEALHGLPLQAMAWSRTGLWLGWPETEKAGGSSRFPWHPIASPKPIERALRVVTSVVPGAVPAIDAFVIFEGENAELGHSHVTITRLSVVKSREQHTPLRTIAQLGPDFVGAQVMLGQPEMGSPLVIAAIRAVPTGTSISFLRVDGGGSILARVQRSIAGFRPLGPVAMMMRVRGSLVEAAFPAVDKDKGELHVLRLATTADLRSIEPPIVSAAIPLEGPTPAMTIAYSHFPPFFPNGVGLLMRQPGDKAFLWTEARGFRRLPFVLRDRDEALLMGRRSSWYVLVNTGTTLSGVSVESYFPEYVERARRSIPPGIVD